MPHKTTVYGEWVYTGPNGEVDRRDCTTNPDRREFEVIFAAREARMSPDWDLEFVPYDTPQERTVD